MDKLCFFNKNLIFFVINHVHCKVLFHLPFVAVCCCPFVLFINLFQCPSFSILSSCNKMFARNINNKPTIFHVEEFNSFGSKPIWSHLLFCYYSEHLSQHPFICKKKNNPLLSEKSGWDERSIFLRILCRTKYPGMFSTKLITSSVGIIALF